MDNAEQAPATNETPADAESTFEPGYSPEDAKKDWRQEYGIEGAQFQKFESPADLAKSYSELEAYRGQSIRIPTEEASEEAWKEFNDKLAAKVPNLVHLPEGNPNDDLYQRLGRPESPDKYDFAEVPGYESEGDSESEFRRIAHEAGLSNKQADRVHNWLASNISRESIESNEAMQAELGKLKSEWGAAYDTKISQAQAAVNMIESTVPGFKDYLDASGNGNDPMFIRMAAALAEQFGEKGNIPARPTGVMTPDEARMKISDIRSNPKHPYNNEFDPAHASAKKHVMGLYKLASGES
jgi:hypothetical protein